MGYFCAMEFTTLTAISPVDGRYRKQTEKLGLYFSEFALIVRIACDATGNVDFHYFSENQNPKLLNEYPVQTAPMAGFPE